MQCATQVCAVLMLMSASHVTADEAAASSGRPAPPGAARHHPSLFEQIVHLGAKHASAVPAPAPPLRTAARPGVDGDGVDDGLDGAAAATEEDVTVDTPAEELVRPAVATAAHGNRLLYLRDQLLRSLRCHWVITGAERNPDSNPRLVLANSKPLIVG
jgi:hypothetical protein